MTLTPITTRISLAIGGLALIAILVLVILLQSAWAGEKQAETERNAAQAKVELLEDLRTAESVAIAVTAELVDGAAAENKSIKEKVDEVRNDGGDGLAAGLDELRRVQSTRSPSPAR